MDTETVTDIKVYVCLGCGYQVREGEVSSILKWRENEKRRLVPECNTPICHGRLMTLESKKLKGLGTFAKEGRAKRRVAEAAARASADEAEPTDVAAGMES